MLLDQTLFQSNNLKQLLVVYANAKPTQDGFVVVSDYRASKHTTMVLNTAIYTQNNTLLSNYFGFIFNLTSNRHELFIKSNLSVFDFFETLFNQIDILRARVSVDDFVDMLLTCFFGLRGSIDLTGKLYAVDLLDVIVNNNPNYIARLQNWVNLINININSRYNQPQYVNGIALRNTQFRVSLRVVFDRVGTEIGQINLYKYNILQTNQHRF